jgi:polyphosphate kinase 2 (PPK2 family)
MLETVDLSQSLDRETYTVQLTRRQIQLRELGYQVYLQKRPVVMAFEGWDAAGKGGAIKRLTERLDPRGYSVYPISAPEGEDKTHHYLYRFWRRLPERGQIAIFDRSWYGRVLVERVEGFCTEEAWRRAFREINSFERQLVEFGAILLKFWIHISREEQLQRFEERERIAYKSWKLTQEDWRNRDKWPAYQEAVEDMLLKTSTVTAPWTVVEGNDKLWARVKVCATAVDVLSRELKYDPREPLRKGGNGRKASK